MEALRTKQFCDSSRPEETSNAVLPWATMTSDSSSSLLRAATGAPAEGQGLRGIDAEVKTEAESCGGYKFPAVDGSTLTTLGTAGQSGAKKLCIRHQSMADEDKTARLQKVSDTPQLMDLNFPFRNVFRRSSIPM